MAIDFSPYGFTAKADASGIDLKVRVFLFDINYHKLPANFHKLLLVSIRVRFRDKGKCAAE